MKKIHCHICNSEMKLADVKGHVFPWKDFSHVRLLVSFETLVCDGCGEMLLEGSDAKTLDDALEASIREQSSVFLSKIKESSLLSQKKLARKIGLSEVYLSEIMGKKKTVSSQIFNFLKILANHPDVLSDLDSFAGEHRAETCEAIHLVGAKSIQIAADLSQQYPYLDEEIIKEKSNQVKFEGLYGCHVRGVVH